MTIELSWGGATAVCTVGGVIAKIIHGLFSAALEKRDSEIRQLRDTHTTDLASLKATQKVLFEKLDKLGEEMSTYKLHVAETYVADAKLEKMLAPVISRLDRIEDDLRDQGRDRDRERV